jgi:hypothetical protein
LTSTRKHKSCIRWSPNGVMALTCSQAFTSGTSSGGNGRMRITFEHKQTILLELAPPQHGNAHTMKIFSCQHKCCCQQLHHCQPLLPTNNINSHQTFIQSVFVPVAYIQTHINYIKKGNFRRNRHVCEHMLDIRSSLIKANRPIDGICVRVERSLF